jgi:hypothetical protein
MTPEQAAHETARAIGDIPSAPMVDAATYARGAELGFEGFDFYVAGRGGVLGDVDADVIAAVLVFFAPATVRPSWERSAAVMARADAVREWAAVAQAHATAHVTDDPRAAELVGRIASSAAVACAPLFAAWRVQPEPEGGSALLVHRLNLLRELRMALHAAALLTVGLSPEEAVAVRAPAMNPVYGWGDLPDPEPLRERWALAEARTDRMMGRHYRALDEAERDELVGRLRSITA